MPEALPPHTHALWAPAHRVMVPPGVPQASEFASLSGLCDLAPVPAFCLPEAVPCLLYIQPHLAQTRYLCLPQSPKLNLGMDILPPKILMALE